jgi:hypothetical protein
VRQSATPRTGATISERRMRARRFWGESFAVMGGAHTEQRRSACALEDSLRRIGWKCSNPICLALLAARSARWRFNPLGALGGALGALAVQSPRCAVTVASEAQKTSAPLRLCGSFLLGADCRSRRSCAVTVAFVAARAWRRCGAVVSEERSLQRAHVRLQRRWRCPPAPVAALCRSGAPVRSRRPNHRLSRRGTGRRGRLW